MLAVAQRAQCGAAPRQAIGLRQEAASQRGRTGQLDSRPELRRRTHANKDGEGQTLVKPKNAQKNKNVHARSPTHVSPALSEGQRFYSAPPETPRRRIMCIVLHSAVHQTECESRGKA